MEKTIKTPTFGRKGEPPEHARWGYDGIMKFVWCETLPPPRLLAHFRSEAQKGNFHPPPNPCAVCLTLVKGEL